MRNIRRRARIHCAVPRCNILEAYTLNNIGNLKYYHTASESEYERLENGYCRDDIVLIVLSDG